MHERMTAPARLGRATINYPALDIAGTLPPVSLSFTVEVRRADVDEEQFAELTGWLTTRSTKEDAHVTLYELSSAQPAEEVSAQAVREPEPPDILDRDEALRTAIRLVDCVLADADYTQQHAVRISLANTLIRLYEATA